MSSATNEWFTFENGMTAAQCNKIKRLGRGKWEDAAVNTAKGLTDEERKTGPKADYKKDTETRISEVVWNNEQWLYDLIWPYMMRANDEAGWQYDIKYAESCQVTKYKKGGFYHFHRDGFQDCLSAYYQPDNAFMHGHVRKLSMSIILNDNFEGDAFEFASYGKEECNITPIEAKRGSVIVFPSWMEHRVAPVTKGIRHSLVCWFLGPPFK